MASCTLSPAMLNADTLLSSHTLLQFTVPMQEHHNVQRATDLGYLRSNFKTCKRVLRYDCQLCAKAFTRHIKQAGATRTVNRTPNAPVSSEVASSSEPSSPA